MADPTGERGEEESREDLRVVVARCLAGDEDAWAALLARLNGLMGAVIRGAGLADADGADVYQRVALTLFEKLHTVRDPARLTTWVVTT